MGLRTLAPIIHGNNTIAPIDFTPYSTIPCTGTYSSIHWPHMQQCHAHHTHFTAITREGNCPARAMAHYLWDVVVGMYMHTGFPNLQYSCTE